MTLKVNGIFVIGGDGKDVHLVAASDLESVKLPIDLLVVSS